MRIYNSMLDVVKEYPVRVPAWVPLDDCFVADASDFRLKPGQIPMLNRVRDPWNRRFPCVSRPVSNKEGELVAWHFTTTVNGQEIECRIFND
jgi:hypothetical protein